MRTLRPGAARDSLASLERDDPIAMARFVLALAACSDTSSP
jgi:hypothetical protein